MNTLLIKTTIYLLMILVLFGLTLTSENTIDSKFYATIAIILTGFFSITNNN